MVTLACHNYACGLPAGGNLQRPLDIFLHFMFAVVFEVTTRGTTWNKFLLTVAYVMCPDPFGKAIHIITFFAYVCLTPMPI